MAGRERGDVSFYLTAFFASSSSAFRRVTKMPAPIIRDIANRLQSPVRLVEGTFFTRAYELTFKMRTLRKGTESARDIVWCTLTMRNGFQDRCREITSERQTIA
jgi:hypothetical protein